MTQARLSPTLNLRLTAMQLPEARVQAAAGHFTSNQQLLLHPGEASEMLVQLENTGNRLLQLNLWVESNCPSSWYLLSTEGRDLAPGQRIEATIRFRPPGDFFENQRALLPEEQLVLDYQCRICADCVEAGTGRRQTETQTFGLYLRPRSLYPNFLPILYREVDFISRFLKIFEQAFEPAARAMDVMWAHLDPLTAPEALLGFLGHWVAWPIDRRWELMRQRRLIRHALEIYRWRGTRRGLRFYLHLYTDLPLDDDRPESDKRICIQETFHRGLTIGEARLGQDSALGGGTPYHFIVRLRPEFPQQVDEALVRLIIEQEKPAFCTYDLYIEERV